MKNLLKSVSPILFIAILITLQSCLSSSDNEKQSIPIPLYATYCGDQVNPTFKDDEDNIVSPTNPIIDKILNLNTEDRVLIFIKNIELIEKGLFEGEVVSVDKLKPAGTPEINNEVSEENLKDFSKPVDIVVNSQYIIGSSLTKKYFSLSYISKKEKEQSDVSPIQLVYSDENKDNNSVTLYALIEKDPKESTNLIDYHSIDSFNIKDGPISEKLDQANTLNIIYFSKSENRTVTISFNKQVNENKNLYYWSYI